MGVDLVAELSTARVMAIIRGSDATAAAVAGLALLAQGVRIVEVALTTPGALAAITAIRTGAPDGCLVGAGTVLTAADVAEVAAAGAQFVVTPTVGESVRAAVHRALPVVAGALSPTEASTAAQMGACAVKLFPASLGGPAYLRAMRGPFPDLPFVAVGGVRLDQTQAYLDAGAIAVGVGGPLVGDGASGGSLDELRARARAYLARVEKYPAR